MQIKSQNLINDIKGMWVCIDSKNHANEEHLGLEFSLLISENLMSRIGSENKFWPRICNFESVGSSQDGYFYREDGTFIQVKSVDNDFLKLELSAKDENGKLQMTTFIFEKFEN
ncbi:hypothetical protein [Marivirga sp.]|uniref:hypothetical protein n=1 Tax=Marivirga sp. TaxID=2018662 RepID=UPI002D7F2CE3|nr:hypothetical protein [Marivirga sp.]HET8861593.1 hypothetical protein [Marivirga sp.]